MKKLFFIAAIAGAALVSCTKNELAPSATEKHEITFASPVVGAQTKAYVNGAIGTNYNTSETFDVWAVYSAAALNNWDDGTEYITKRTVTWNGKGWAFNPAYYWPATGFLSFVALSPVIEEDTSYDGEYGFKIVGWEQGEDETAIVDLMYSDENRNNSKSYYNTEGEENGTGGKVDGHNYKGVDIKFNHALSYLVFKIKTSDDYSQTTSFRLNSITLSDIYRKGDFIQIPQNGVKNWSVYTDNNNKLLGEYVAYNNPDGLVFDSVIGEDEGPLAVDEGCDIILLPQLLTEGQQKITINYQIRTNDTPEGIWFDQTQTIDLCATSIKEWEMGKKYTYTISIGAQEIIFDPAVSVWEDGGSDDIEL